MADRIKTVLPIILCCLFAWPTISLADFQQNRYYKVRQKISLNQGWKFYKNNPVGNPFETGFNDAGWSVVNVPHSAAYVAPTPADEKTTLPGGQWTGVCWYRKSFTLLETGHSQKVYLEFEGAMQSATVWVNGIQAGMHDASGYSGFSFDISALVNRNAVNVVAIKLDCNYSSEIPPGLKKTTSGPNAIDDSYPDYYLFSGLYRDVWLVCSGNVYVPLNGQKITTPEVASAGTAKVRVRTTVRNDTATAKTCTVRWVVVDASNAIIADKSQTAVVGANASVVFDTLTPTLSGLKLWSPESPNLYRVFTKVSSGGIDVDDYVERFGFRKLDWTVNNGFSLNGSRYLLRGVCMHQEFAWVGNALPASRYFEEVKLIKDMGGNAVRCSHYPRDPSFYNACDELGVICEVELPTWGNYASTYPAAFWTRMAVVAGEMVDVGYNHPSIILWGLFNEPYAEYTTQITQLNATIKAKDSTRFTSIINNHITQQQNTIPDVFGLNYNLATSLSNVKTYNAEYYEGWVKWCYRGDTSTVNDAFLTGSLSENKHAIDRWSGSNNWTSIEAYSPGGNKPLAGGHMWCFIDYWSPFMDHPMGVLDHYRIPKKAYYTFRTAWTQKPDDYGAIGLTAAKIQLDADVTTLIADSTDLSRVIASVRDASGKCVFTSNTGITFLVTGPCDVFDTISTPRMTIAGKTAIIIKSKNAPGDITIKASSGALAPATITLKSIAADNSALLFTWPTISGVLVKADARIGFNVTVRQIGQSLRIEFLGNSASKARIALMTLQGKSLHCPAKVSGSLAVLDIRSVPSGCYCLCIGQNIKRNLFVNNPPKGG